MEPRANGRDFVIKVKYGDTLKRFSAHVHGEAIDHNMARLKKRIVTLFKLSSEVDFILTYLDEDGEVVALDDDDELHDAAINQHLNPLRINVCLKSSTSKESYLRNENASSTTAATADCQQEENQSPGLSSIIDEVLKPVPEQFRSSLSKFSADFLPKIASSSPVIADIVDHISKLGIQNVSPSLNRSTGEPSEIPNQTKTQPKDLNITEEPKILKTSAPVSAISSDPVSEQLHKKLVPTSQVDIDKTQASVCSPNLPAFEQTSGNPSIDDLLRTFGSSSETADRQNQISNVSHHGKSVRACPPFFVPPLQTGTQNENYNPSAPALTNAVTDLMDDHDNKQLPTGAAPTGTFDGLNFEGDKQQPTTVDPPFVIGVRSNSSGVRPNRHPNQRDDAFIDNLLHTFHRGIICDGCGMHPIVGPRYKSKVKDNYDLCSICFSEMGHEAAYTRIDKSHRFSRKLFKQSHRAHYRRRSSHLHGFGMPRAKLESVFIKDVTVLDGTLIPPSTPFTKIWRMGNNGTVRWPFGTRLVWVGGDRFANQDTVLLEISFGGFPMEEVDIAVDFVSPAMPGKYVSYWRLATPSGHKFGQQVWLLIEVDISQRSSFSGLNLNLPPESSIQGQIGTIDINVDPSDGLPPESVLGDSSGKLVKPNIIYETTKLDANPTNNDAPASDAVPLSNPLIDLTASKGDYSQLLPPPTTQVDNTVEDTLLKELEDMGFKQIDLNKEVLMRNEYDLEQSVDELCDYAEWYPLLEELEDMGFSDRVKNKQLLIKNGGSIKRTVLDLIAGERA
ncbi:protein JOKA2-like [Curcuma longa]|uniref:protein JOKA2-like n=1 Tax=Curcuma longa TaxID=136217 RepID=UPI003D9DFB58